VDIPRDRRAFEGSAAISWPGAAALSFCKSGSVALDFQQKNSGLEARYFF
jgi:hypothetical protein